MWEKCGHLYASSPGVGSSGITSHPLCNFIDSNEGSGAGLLNVYKRKHVKKIERSYDGVPINLQSGLFLAGATVAEF